MAVLINFKICDNAKECNGIEVCPTGALSWDDKKETILIDNEKCTNCGKCEPACEVHAIRVAKTDEEYKQIKKEFDEDPRRVEDLFVDRYGAEPVDRAFIIPDGRFDLEVLEATKPTVVEFFNDDSIMCLLHSIPIKELFKGYDIKYRRVYASDDSLVKRFGIKELPSLLFFSKGKLIGKTDGYFDIKELDAVRNSVQEIMSKV